MEENPQQGWCCYLGCILEIYGAFCLFVFWLHRVTCGISVPRLGMEPMPPAVEAWSLNHWTTREVPVGHFLIDKNLKGRDSLAFSRPVQDATRPETLRNPPLIMKNS